MKSYIFSFFRILWIQNEFKSKVFSWMNWFFSISWEQKKSELMFLWQMSDKIFRKLYNQLIFYPNIFANVYLVLIAIFYVCDNFSTWLNLQKSLMRQYFVTFSYKLLSYYPIPFKRTRTKLTSKCKFFRILEKSFYDFYTLERVHVHMHVCSLCEKSAHVIFGVILVYFGNIFLLFASDVFLDVIYGSLEVQNKYQFFCVRKNF